MERKLNFGLVGYGNIGKRHAEILLKIGILSSICDKNIDILKLQVNSNQTRFYSNIDEMLQFETELDFVVICTPNNLHAEHCIKALSKKINVICEKPMALQSIDCFAMKNAAIQNGVRLFIVKQNRFNPAVSILKDLIENKHLGDIFSFQINCFWNRNSNYYNSEWRGKKSMDGGLLFTQFSHFIDLFIWLFGIPEDICGFSNNFNHESEIEFEDTGVVSLKFKNGVIAGLNYSINAFEKNMEGSATILGSKGTIKIGGEYLNKVEYLVLENKPIQTKIEKNISKNFNRVYEKSYAHQIFYEYVLNELSVEKHYSKYLEDSIETVQTIERIIAILNNSISTN